MPSSRLTADGSGQVYSDNSFRLVAREGFSENGTRLLTPGQTRWALSVLLLFSFNAFIRAVYHVGQSKINEFSVRSTNYYVILYESTNADAKIHHLIERALISMISFNYKSKENGLGSNI